MTAAPRLACFVIDSAESMEALGAELARVAVSGFCLHLSGPLAAGKTTLARGYVRQRGHQGAVKSPTFTLVESYELPAGTIHHFDLYRLAAAEELEFIGIEDYFDGCAEVLVEWPERGTGVMPGADLVAAIAVKGSGRKVCLTALTRSGIELISRINKQSISNS